MDLEGGGAVPNPFTDLHPLLIPGVLENVFEYCGFKELTACRLVSKDWHENSLKRWRSLAKVKLVVGEGDRSRPMTRLMNFVKREEKKNDSFKPYSGSFVIEGVKNLDPLMKGFGLQISALELKNVAFKNVREFRKVIFQSCPSMKELTLLNPIQVLNSSLDIPEPREWVEPQFGENFNLKRLTLPRSTRSFGITRMEILSHFPALEVLILKERSFQARSWLESEDYMLFRVVEIIRSHDPTKLQLKGIEDLEIVQPAFNATFCVPISLTRLLANDPRLSLEHIAVNLDGSVMNAEFILRTAIIRQQRATLKKLELFRNPGEVYLDASGVFQPYPRLWPKNIEELILRSRVFSDPCFLTGVPNIRKLTIYGMEDENGRDDNVFRRTCWLCIKMRSLVLDKCTELSLAFHLHKKDLERVVRLFPNVKKATISLDNQMFAVVCRNWTQLVELNVFDSSLDDAGITGLDAKEVICANEKRPLPSGRGDRNTAPNISSLTHLRRVSISNWERFPITKSLGHASATFGFERVPCLQYLHITNYYMEEDVKDAMRKCATSCVFTRTLSDKATLLEGLKKSLF